jgi:dihydrofolate reductase
MTSPSAQPRPTRQRRRHRGHAKKVTEGNTVRIKARMGMSLDGYVATTDGTPSLIKAADFVPGQSHGYPEFIAGCDAVAMGRQTFLPALGAPQWPWGDMTVYVLTSRPLPAGTPESIITCTAGPAGLVRQLRSGGSDGDVHLVGGPRTIQAFCQQEALDNLEVVVLPLLLGDGIPLWPHGSQPPTLRLLHEPRVFPYGSVELSYSTA